MQPDYRPILQASFFAHASMSDLIEMPIDFDPVVTTA